MAAENREKVYSHWENVLFELGSDTVKQCACFSKRKRQEAREVLIALWAEF